jgi:hypothetical protein
LGEGAEAHEQIYEQILEIKFKNIHIDEGGIRLKVVM